MDCARFLAVIPEYLDDTLPEPARTAWRQHLGECAGCRRRALSVEPTLALASVRAGEPSAAEIERCVSGVRALIHEDRLGRRLRSRRRGWLAAAAAVLALAAAAVWQLAVPTAGPGSDGATVAETRPAPEVEVDMEGADVRVYHLAVDGDPDTAVTLVVNPALEL